MIKQGVNITIHPLMLLLSNSNAAMNTIPVLNVMKKQRSTKQQFGRKKNGIPKQSYVEYAKKN